MSFRLILASLSIFFLTRSVSGNTQWLRVGVGEKRCASTCGRTGMDNVLTAKSDAIGQSICATLGPVGHKMTAGSQRPVAGQYCDIASGHKNTNNYYCLCADDGVADGADITWITSQNNGRCDNTCKTLGPKKYGYAVYASYIEHSWTHVCMAQDGSIGVTGGGRNGCRTATGTAEAFQCLCTRSFSGDLEAHLDP